MNIETVDLNTRNIILPSDRVGIVVAHPYVNNPRGEPFRWNAGRVEQLALIRRTLEIAELAAHGAGKTHFTLFPEYSIPGLEGIRVIDDALTENDWPVGTIVIGGTEGLSPGDYRLLAGTNNTHHHAANSPDEVGADEWVNCGVTWVKSARDRIERWLQPKAIPAMPEWNTRYRHMFPGKGTYVFRAKFENGSPCLFFSLICFDWIGRENGDRLWQAVLRGIDVSAGGDLPISWAFVIELNDQPNHHTFLESAATFFQSRHQYTQTPRDQACLLFANCAGNPKPGRVGQYGFSGLIFSDAAHFVLPECHPTYASNGRMLRKADGLGECKDILFRESGACIHSFAQNVSAFVPGGVAGRRPPISQALVYPITGGADEPRTPSAAVPASVKYLNDMLDGIDCLSHLYPNAGLAADIAAEHNRNIDDIRHAGGAHAEQIVCRASCDALIRAPEGDKRVCKPPDTWSESEEAGVGHVVHTLDILRIAFAPFDIANSSAHATVTMREREVEIIGIRGKSHDDCLRHAETIFPTRGHKMIVVSRDRDNNEFVSRFGSFMKPKAKLQGESQFTNLESNKVVVGYRSLLSNYQESQKRQQLEESLYASFNLS